MVRNVVFTTATKRPANVAVRTKRRLAALEIGDALGASDASPMPVGPDTPLGFVALRKEVAAALRSTGGRPGLQNVERRKIPVTEAVWRVVTEAAEAMSAVGFHPSPAQVASVILEIAVRDNPGLLDRAEIALRAPMERVEREASSG